MLLTRVYCVEGCMLGCRDYIELAMYRPRDGAAPASLKQVNGGLTEDAIKTSSRSGPWSAEDDSSGRRRSMDQFNAAPG